MIEQFFAKSNNNTFGQTVLEHCICVGEMAKCLADFFGYKNFPPNIIAFICAMHDIGKLSPIFQNKIGNKSLLNALNINKNFNKDEYNQVGSHSGIGAIYMDKINKSISTIILRHHGYSSISPNNISPSTKKRICNLPMMNTHINEFIEKLESYFNVKCSEIKIEGIDYELISGYLSLADWLVSDKLWDNHDLKNIDYNAILKSVGITKIITNDNLIFKNIFGFLPYPFQEDIINQINDYGFYLVESGNGSGKTEIAFMSAYNLILNHKANGLIFALPTQVTSNANFIRAEKFCKKISVNENVNLIHSKSKDALYEYSKNRKSNEGEEYKETDNFYKNNKNLKLFNNFISCTVDQLLYAILNTKFNFMRETALWHKVIIIDEIHCYDSLTTELIRKLIEFCNKCECTVIALSATVSDSLKENFFGKHVFKNNYPLLTYVKKDGILNQHEINQTNTIVKNFNVTMEYNEDNSIKNAVEEVKNGLNILWIENTVSKAQSIYAKFKKILGNNYETGMLHSHFTLNDRLNNESHWLGFLGKDQSKRINTGSILISTQVAEQSLDISADKLYTRICPIDALGQRLGRIGRFDYSGKYYDVIILSEHTCKEYENGLKTWYYNDNALEYSSFIYPKIILYRTQKYFENNPVIHYPHDYRTQLNYVYDNLTYIDGFNLYNKFLDNYNENNKAYKDMAERMEISYGKTKKGEDVQTRAIRDDSYNALLIRNINGDMITMFNGNVIDFSQNLTQEDLIIINKNICPVKIKLFENVVSQDVLSYIQELNEKDIVNCCLKVSPTQEIYFINDCNEEKLNAKYNSIEGIIYF